MQGRERHRLRVRTWTGMPNTGTKCMLEYSNEFMYGINRRRPIHRYPATMFLVRMVFCLNYCTDVTTMLLQCIYICIPLLVVVVHATVTATMLHFKSKIYCHSTTASKSTSIALCIRMLQTTCRYTHSQALMWCKWMGYRWGGRTKRLTYNSLNGLNDVPPPRTTGYRHQSTSIRWVRIVNTQNGNSRKSMARSFDSWSLFNLRMDLMQ